MQRKNKITLVALDMMHESLKASGIRGLINYIMLLLKFGRQPPIFYKNVPYYSSYEQMTNKALLRNILQYLRLSVRLTNNRTFVYYQNQTFGWNRMVYTYITDTKEDNCKYVSHVLKQNSYQIYKAIQKAGNGQVILDKSLTSTLDKPSFYVLEENTGTYTVVVRGTVNQWDRGTDLDIVQSLVEFNGEKFYLHQGFYRMALALFGTMDEYNLLDDNKQYVTCGHSLGGAIACILGFLLITRVTQKVTTYTFGMPPTGSYNFSIFCKSFCWSIVNNCDLICGMSMHGFNVQQQRLLYQNSSKMNAYDKKYLISGIIDNQNVIQSIEEQNESKEQFYQTSAISKLMMTQESNFVCGNIIHFIHGKFYIINAHDIAEFSANLHNAFDHFTYQWLGDYIEEILQTQ